MQVVKLIRSKGVGVYFVTQSPSDIPDEVLAQLSNRIQHGMRAYTPAELRAVRAAADGFRANPAFDTQEAMLGLGTGEALVSFLEPDGVPETVEKANILPPQSLMGPADGETVKELILGDEFELKYREAVDRQSAYEIISEANRKLAEEKEKADSEKKESKKKKKNGEEDSGEEEDGGSGKKSGRGSSKTRKKIENAAASAANSAARSVGRNLVSSLTGSSKKSAGKIVSQAASSALSSLLGSSAVSIIRGLFGNKK